MFMNYFCTKVNMPCSSDHLTYRKTKAEEKFYTAAILLFYILQKILP
jgi:hypothetical protein